LLKNIFYYIKGVAFGSVQLRAVRDIRNRFYEHLHELSMSFYHRKRPGEISSIMLHDVSNMRQALSTSFNQLLIEPINILSFIVLLFIISWQLTLIAIVILPLSLFIIRVIGMSIRRKSIRSSRRMAGIMSILNETVQGMRVVKAFAMEKFEINRFFGETWNYFKIVFRRTKLRHLSPPLNEITAVTIGIVLLYIGGRQVLSGTGLDTEDFIRFVFLIFAMLEPIKKLNRVNIRIQKGIASAIRVFRILDEKTDIFDKPDAQNIESFDKKIEYQNLCFRYITSEEDILSDINLTINKGETIAVVGHSGAGKTTLADLLPRFYDPIKGSIKIDSVDIRDLTLKSLRRMMGIVTQETVLFNDSVLNNIAYGLSEVDMEAVEKAAEAANALDFINELENKFDTIIGDKGSRLSGGQRQRIAIARALLKNPPILILDEATSSLDSESEIKVKQAIDNLMKERTAIVIAHRLSTIRNADRIIVIESGKIVETGTHRSLLAKGGKYKLLHEAQKLDQNK